MNIGAHVSIAKGIENTPEIAAKWGCEAMQIFTHSPQGGNIFPLEIETVKIFKENCRKFSIKEVYIHAPYYINLASKNNRIYYGSISAIRKNLERASDLGAKYLMTHLGSAKDFSEKETFDKLLVAFKKIFDGYSGSAKLLIENSAGAGKIIGSDFKQIGEILKAVTSKSDLEARGRTSMSILAGICLDAQHSFASGYDWKNNFEKSLRELDKNIDAEKIKLIHANDSATELNSHKDRHIHIGKGKIGLEGFEKLVAFAKRQNIDMICETAYPEVVKDIAALKDIRDKIH